MIPVFVDSDVIISSLLSSTGAAHFLLNETNDLSLFISTLSKEELERVAERLHIEKEALDALLQERFSTIALDNNEQIKKEYRDYVLDNNDAHVAAGADSAKARFLISYNIRHFKIDKMREDLGIIVVTPAIFIQYLRSLK